MTQNQSRAVLNADKNLIFKLHVTRRSRKYERK